MRTIITHFYNEEYLLPWWLNHHKKYFDHGVLIDYSSTDRSVEIIKSICPTWQILPSAFGHFDAYDCDREVEFYERQLPDWRIALTVTEFLVGDIYKLTSTDSNSHQWSIPPLLFAAYEPFKTLDTNKPLWEQCATAVSYRNSYDSYYYANTNVKILSRSMHRFNNMNYDLGRHVLPHNTEAAAIFKFSNCLIGEPMIKRRLQISGRVSERDKSIGCAEHHVYAGAGGLNLLTLPQWYMQNILSLNPIDCTDIIKELTS